MVAEKQHVVDVLVDFFDDEFVDFFELKMIVTCFFTYFNNTNNIKPYYQSNHMNNDHTSIQ